MVPENTKKVIEKFGMGVVSSAKKNIVKGKHIVTGRLHASIGFDAFIHKNSFSLGFNMMYYGWFLDQGTRRGIKPTYFFTKPFNDNFEEMQDEVVEAFGLELESFLKYTLDDVFKDINSKKKK